MRIPQTPMGHPDLPAGVQPVDGDDLFKAYHERTKGGRNEVATDKMKAAFRAQLSKLCNEKKVMGRYNGKTGKSEVSRHDALQSQRSQQPATSRRCARLTRPLRAQACNDCAPFAGVARCAAMRWLQAPSRAIRLRGCPYEEASRAESAASRRRMAPLFCQLRSPSTSASSLPVAQGEVPVGPHVLMSRSDGGRKSENPWRSSFAMNEIVPQPGKAISRQVHHSERRASHAANQPSFSFLARIHAQEVT